ncbi:hypothetical protein SRB5_52940 [Streptomyces sp. RB5]|uniref:DNA-binding phage zinc finger domain-containing protein n=1 Tax=Streptomyces smaragdinus TaxID=2585196 RepID=A0A7K0CNQ0_9ACTN|nr:hypothetical protein [Streptomyces smaragdinus]MQY15116.1 hypothetical protein [Streptomyces smaragdinus]
MDTRNRAGEWLHKYQERDLPELPPARPYAVYLSSKWGRYRWLCFDLDAKRGDVGPDLATLLRWLDEAGLSYVVAASGSAEGRHVWVAAATLLDSVLVHAIADEAARRLPTLDHGLLKSRTGAARPIGAPHRNGHRSELLHPADPPTAAARLTPRTCGNDSEAFTRLLLVIDAVPTPERVRPRIVGVDEFAEVLDDELGPRLAGTARTLLDRDTMGLLTRRPPADQVSEACGSLLTRLALRRWTLPMVKRLLDTRAYREGGLLHLCTSPGIGPLRVNLHPADTTEKLERNWRRCVSYASRLPSQPESLVWAENLASVVDLVNQIQAAADATPERWATQAGPGDRALLDLLCLLALRSGTTVLDLDLRRAAIATGGSRSGMHRAQQRLGLDGWLSARGSEGPAGTYELLPITADHPGYTPVAQGGTQGNPPPTQERRDALVSRLRARLSAGQADAFAYGRRNATHGGGLGHHAGRIYQQLLEHGRPLSVSEMCAKTGYEPRTVQKHLARMQGLMVVTRAVLTVHHECPTCEAGSGERCSIGRGGRVPRHRGADQHAARGELAVRRAGTPYYRPRQGSLLAAAKVLGSYGRLAARARRYAVEIEQYHWWKKEEAWMRAPKAGMRTGVHVHEGQTALVVTTLDRQPWRRYPRDADGRADHSAARVRVERRLATA